MVAIGAASTTACTACAASNAAVVHMCAAYSYFSPSFYQRGAIKSIAVAGGDVINARSAREYSGACSSSFLVYI